MFTLAVAAHVLGFSIFVYAYVQAGWSHRLSAVVLGCVCIPEYLYLGSVGLLGAAVEATALPWLLGGVTALVYTRQSNWHIMFGAWLAMIVLSIWFYVGWVQSIGWLPTIVATVAAGLGSLVAMLAVYKVPALREDFDAMVVQSMDKLTADLGSVS